MSNANIAVKRLINEKQHRLLELSINRYQLDRDRVKKYVVRKFKIDDFSYLSNPQLTFLLNKFPSFAKIQREEEEEELIAASQPENLGPSIDCD